jgi:hypothetical protein
MAWATLASAGMPACASIDPSTSTDVTVAEGDAHESTDTAIDALSVHATKKHKRAKGDAGAKTGVTEPLPSGYHADETLTFWMTGTHVRACPGTAAEIREAEKSCKHDFGGTAVTKCFSTTVSDGIEFYLDTNCTIPMPQAAGPYAWSEPLYAQQVASCWGAPQQTDLDVADTVYGIYVTDCLYHAGVPSDFAPGSTAGISCQPSAGNPTAPLNLAVRCSGAAVRNTYCTVQSDNPAICSCSDPGAVGLSCTIDGTPRTCQAAPAPYVALCEPTPAQ